MAQTVKNLPAMWATRVPFLDQEDPWRRKWQPIPIFLPGKSHEQWSLAGYSPWSHKEWDMTEWLTLSLFMIIWELTHNTLLITTHWLISNKVKGILEGRSARKKLKGGFCILTYFNQVRVCERENSINSPFWGSVAYSLFKQFML